MDTIIYLAQNYDHVYKVICVVLAIIVILYVVKRLKDRSSRKQRAAKLQSQCQHVAATDTIFVNIAMYRDYTECTNTLLDMFEKAYCPKRITVGICQHLRDGQDKNVLDIYRKAAKSQEQSYENQIRVLTEYAEDARGAMHARALVDKHLYRGEKYYLVIDSHSMFEKDWDLKLVQQLEKATEVAKHDKVVVTQIPEDVDMIQRTLTTLRHVKPNYFPVFDDWEPYLPFKSPVFKKQMFVHAPKRPF
jgi:regulatory protein YycI of two-component signal transduction system YycFG